MSTDPTITYVIASSRHRARVRDATLRHVAATAPDRHWSLRPTRSVRKLLP